MSPRELSLGAEIDLRSPARRRLVDDVVQQLRQLILDEVLPPGTALLQTELAEQLGVSRTPLREAFRILERDGLVRVANGNRTIEVARFGPVELRELYEVREVIDGLAARLLARRGVNAELDQELRGLLTEMDGARRPFHPSIWFPAHTRFHVRIADCCGNAQLQPMLDLIRMTSLSLHTAFSERAEAGLEDVEHVLEIAQEQHHAIYEAMVAGDEHTSEWRARRHIRATLLSNLIEQATEPVEGELTSGASGN